MFCNTNECDADQGFLPADSNRASSLITIAVQRQAVDSSIPSISDFTNWDNTKQKPSNVPKSSRMWAHWHSKVNNLAV